MPTPYLGRRAKAIVGRGDDPIHVAGEATAAGKLQHIAQDLALIQSMGVKVVLVHGFRSQVN